MQHTKIERASLPAVFFRDPDIRPAWRLGWNFVRREAAIDHLEGFIENRCDLYMQSCVMPALDYMQALAPKKEIMVYLLAYPALEMRGPEENAILFGPVIAALSEEMKLLDSAMDGRPQESMPFQLSPLALEVRNILAPPPESLAALPVDGPQAHRDAAAHIVQLEAFVPRGRQPN